MNSIYHNEAQRNKFIYIYIYMRALRLYGENFSLTFFSPTTEILWFNLK